MGKAKYKSVHIYKYDNSTDATDPHVGKKHNTYKLLTKTTELNTAKTKFESAVGQNTTTGFYKVADLLYSTATNKYAFSTNANESNWTASNNKIDFTDVDSNFSSVDFNNANFNDATECGSGNDNLIQKAENFKDAATNFKRQANEFQGIQANFNI